MTAPVVSHDDRDELNPAITELVSIQPQRAEYELTRTPGQLWGRLADLNERKNRSEWVARHDYDGEVCRRAVRQHDCGRNHTYRMSDSDDERRLQRRDAESIFYGLTSIDDE